jgi:hypothetical protein
LPVVWSSALFITIKSLLSTWNPRCFAQCIYAFLFFNLQVRAKRCNVAWSAAFLSRRVKVISVLLLLQLHLTCCAAHGLVLLLSTLQVILCHWNKQLVNIPTCNSMYSSAKVA